MESRGSVRGVSAPDPDSLTLADAPLVPGSRCSVVVADVERAGEVVRARGDRLYVKHATSGPLYSCGWFPRSAVSAV